MKSRAEKNGPSQVLVSVLTVRPARGRGLAHKWRLRQMSLQLERLFPVGLAVGGRNILGGLVAVPHANPTNLR